MLRILKAASALAGAALLQGAACTTRTPAATTSDSAVAESDSLRIIRLEREARALASTKGCSRASDCRSAPVGARACGGPRSYIVYCVATTDTVKLFSTLRELERVETDFNRRAGRLSDCMFRAPPTVTLVSGSCRETSAAP